MRTRRAAAIGAAALTVIVACSAIAVVQFRHSAGLTGSSSSTFGKPAPTSVPGLLPVSLTRWHYTSNSNFGSNGQYLPGALGFNLADVSSVEQLNSLPAGVLGLVWLGYCGGDDTTFGAKVSPMIGNPHLFGFYMADDADPSTCPPANLKAECEWIHRHMAGARTFAILENLGSPKSPTFGTSYTPTSSDLNLVGVDAYPVRSGLSAPDYAEIPAYVRAVKALGWPQASLVPVFQAFGGGTWAGNPTWTLPTPGQEQRLIGTWASLLPAPLFDYAYSWGQQRDDTSLSMSPSLQRVFAVHNA